MNTLGDGNNFPDAYNNLDKLFQAIGDEVKTTKLHLDRIGNETTHASFGRMTKPAAILATATTPAIPAEPWLTRHLRAKVDIGTCNLAQVEKIIGLADELAKNLDVSVTPQQFEAKLDLYLKVFLDGNSSVNVQDIATFDKFLNKVPSSGKSGLGLMDTTKLSTYAPGGRLFNTTADGDKLQKLWDVFIGDESDKNSSTKQRYLSSAISEGKLPISGKPLTVSGATPDFASDYTNLTNLFAAVGDEVKTTKLHLDRMASESTYQNLFVGMNKVSGEPKLINQLKAKVDLGDCNLAQAQKVIELAQELQRNRKSSGTTAAAIAADQLDFEKKLKLYSTIFLDKDSSVNVKDIAAFDKFLSATPSAGASGLGLIDTTKLTNYVPAPRNRLFVDSSTTPAPTAAQIQDANKLQDLWNVFIGDESDKNSSTKQRYLSSAISEGKLPISGKPLNLNTLKTGTNFPDAYTNLTKLFAAVDDADLMRELKIDSWVDNLSASKLSYHNKEDVKRVFNSSFDASSDNVISKFQNLFESGIYDLSSLKYFKELMEDQKKTEADLRAMIKLNIFSLEDLNAYSNANSVNVKLKPADGKVDKDAQVNYWVGTGFSLNGTPLKIDNVTAHKDIFKDFLSDDVSDAADSVLKTGTYYLNIYNNLGPGPGRLAGSSKDNISAFRDAHNRGAEPRELMDLVEYSLAEGLSYADINTPIATGDKSILEYLTSPTDSSNMNGYNIKPQFARRHELLKEALVTQSVPAVSGFTYNNSKTEFENLKTLLGSVKADGSI